MSDTARTDRSAPFTVAELDVVLTAQLAVAWAGESGEEARLGWWRSDLVSEYGGEDLFQRLLPHTWRWAVLQAAREAARRRDAESRAQYHDPDQIVALFCLGFEIDEHLDERLHDLKRSGAPPDEALPTLRQVVSRRWDKGAFTRWLESHGRASFVAEPIGRRIKGAPPPQLSELAGQLLAALNPPTERYPLPHFRRAG
jgi:hypothetical protein